MLLMGYIKCFDSGDDAMRMSELKRREVINVCDCKRLGFVGDLDVDPCTGRILAIIVPGPGCVCGFLGREKEFVIPFGDICQIGDDIILVRVEEKKEKPPKPPKPCPPPPKPPFCPCPPPCEPGGRCDCPPPCNMDGGCPPPCDQEKGGYIKKWR